MKNGQKNDRKKISKTHLVLLIAAVVIVLVSLFFLIKIVRGNPLQGKWATAKGEYYLTLEDNEKNGAKLIVLVEEELVEVNLDYEIDKKAKTIIFISDPEAYEVAVEDFEGKVTALALYEQLEILLKAYDYSLEKNTLTLTEREYGEQIIFTRVK